MKPVIKEKLALIFLSSQDSILTLERGRELSPPGKWFQYQDQTILWKCLSGRESILFSWTFLLPGWCISAVLPVTCHGLSWWQSSVAAALFPESNQWLISLLTWFSRDWKTDFTPWFQWAVAKAPLSGSLAYKSHSWETDNLIGVFGVKVITQQRLGVWFPFLSCLWEAGLSFQVYCVGRLILTQYLGWCLGLMDIIVQLSKVPLSKSYMSCGLCDRQKLLRDEPDRRISSTHYKEINPYSENQAKLTTSNLAQKGYVPQSIRQVRKEKILAQCWFLCNQSFPGKHC